MKKLASIITAALYSLSVLAGSIALVPVRVAAHDADKAQVAATDTKKEEAKPSQAAVVYKYIAQPGDSYSVLARKAVQTYGIKNKVKLSRAKIIAAETWLTQAASSPILDVQQAVELPESTVKQHVDKAQKLSAEDEAAWSVYVSSANFDTSAVGQAR